MMIKVYTDAGYRNGFYSWALAIEKDGIIDTRSGIIKAQCDNIHFAELIAVFYAIYYIHKMYDDKTLEVCCDNETVINYMSGKAKFNAGFYIQREIYKIIYKNDINVSYSHVKGHEGNRLNELCDNLCYFELIKYN